MKTAVMLLLMMLLAMGYSCTAIRVADDYGDDGGAAVYPTEMGGCWTITDTIVDGVHILKSEKWK
jgi:hypothetical protein